MRVSWAGSSAALLPALLSVACDRPPARDDGPRTVVEAASAAPQCADRSPLRNAYFGDLHVHTSYSFDAYTFETRNTPEDAYAFAKGATVGLPPLDSQGLPTRQIRLQRPLDFAAATDHSEFLGEVDLCTTVGSPAYNSSTCRAYRSNPVLGFVLFAQVLAQPQPSRLAMCNAAGVDCDAATRTVWQRIRDAAAQADDPCQFTSFVAYEWTGTTGGSNLHRNVVFEDHRVPIAPVSYIDAPTPQGLWQSLEATCLSGTPGCDVIAIPHNSNLSNGNMFLPENADGSPLSAADAAFRARMEPLVEMMQHKGDSECRYSLLGGDEECRWEKVASSDDSGSNPGFVREALKSGLLEQQRIGSNPFEMGFIGSTDTHNGTPGATEESAFMGHGGTNDADPEGRIAALDFGPGGLAVAWSEDNTRASLFEAFRRRETYATSGTRIEVRMFGGWNYPASLCSNPGFVSEGYAGGVPMGGVLPARPRFGRPKFAVMATWDPGTSEQPGTRLQRIQIVKGWVDAQGRTRERVFDVAGSANNGASVDLTTCSPTGPGASQLCTVWEDPSFNPNRPAFYYARVLENPSCRWSTYECLRAQVQCGGAVPAGFEYCCDGSAPLTQSERAWSSPVWYQP